MRVPATCGATLGRMPIPRLARFGPRNATFLRTVGPFRPLAIPRKSCNALKINGLSSETAGTRTQGLRIKSPLLYQLSYSLENLICEALATIVAARISLVGRHFLPGREICPIPCYNRNRARRLKDPATFQGFTPVATTYQKIVAPQTRRRSFTPEIIASISRLKPYQRETFPCPTAFFRVISIPRC